MLTCFTVPATGVSGAKKVATTGGLSRSTSHLRHAPGFDGGNQPDQRDARRIQRPRRKQVSVQRGRCAGKVLNPGWLASAVFTIAKDTGWSEDFIIWRLPMARALQYYHCSLQAANLWTLEPPTQETMQALAPDELIGIIDRMVDDADDDDG